MNIRPPAVAGLFYPDDPTVLRQTVTGYLAAARPQPVQAPKVLVVPHAGFIYSGPVAASAYRLLEPLRQRIRRVILLGPSHRVALRGIALPTATAFRTPLGDIPIDSAALQAAARLPQTGFLDLAHRDEHSLEVQLPFLQAVLEDFSLVPLVVGEATAEQVADVLSSLWGGDETLIVISSDLSHYLPYRQAIETDKRTADHILHFQHTLAGDEACGCRPLNGLLLLAQRKHLTPILLDLRNSGDTAGSKDRVVGYGAFVFHG